MLGLNLTRIESQPAGLGEYLFIDLVGHREDPRVAEALEAVIRLRLGYHLLQKRE